MKKRRFKRILSGILASLMMVTSSPVTGFAAVADDVPDEMKSNVFLDALAYTGYDLQAQIDDGTLYKNISGAIPSSVQLAKKPVECLEYVILHELAHVKVRNHGKDFVAILDNYMPYWRETRKLLNELKLDYLDSEES